jgi:hypothetical protein
MYSTATTVFVDGGLMHSSPVWVFLQGVLFGLKDVLKEKYDLRRMAVGMRAPTYWSW